MPLMPGSTPGRLRGHQRLRQPLHIAWRQSGGRLQRVRSERVCGGPPGAAAGLQTAKRAL